MLVYLDNSATTRQYDEVTDLMALVAKEDYGNPSSLHRLGIAGEERMKKARAEVAKRFPGDGELYFNSCGTEADNTAIFGTALSKRKTGKKIITTKVEHPAVLEACKRLESLGFTIQYLDVDRYCNVSADDVRNAIDDDTVMISVMTVNNEVGTIMPINEIAKVRDSINRNIILHTDAVQAYGKLDLKNINADLISVSAHKIHGPKGVGALYVRDGVNVAPFMVGGGQEKGFRSATENTPGIAGFALASKMAYENLSLRQENMLKCKEYLKKGILAELKDVTVNTPENSVCSVLNLSFLGTRGEVILHTLEQDGIFVSTGSACSSNHKITKGSHVLNAMGMKEAEITGAVRFSFSEFNTIEEMDYTVQMVKKAVTKFRRLMNYR
ncbi:MAG: cysteine desulfurase [Clostridia bacterium]|nr:cysteine desulfurase [Clostridia bacterium]